MKRRIFIDKYCYTEVRTEDDLDFIGRMIIKQVDPEVEDNKEEDYLRWLSSFMMLKSFTHAKFDIVPNPYSTCVYFKFKAVNKDIGNDVYNYLERLFPSKMEMLWQE